MVTSTGRGERRREFLRGVRDQLPLLLGVIPFGLIFGALAIANGIPPLATQGLSLFVFAGSAQFIAAGLIGEAAPALVVIGTIFIVNLRHMLYSATLAPHYEHLPARWKMSLAWLLTDEAFATTSVRYQRSSLGYAHWYAFGTGLTLWVSWQLSTALGIALGARISDTGGLDFALPVTFLALLMPQLTTRPAWAAAVAAGLTAILLAPLPFRLGLVLACLVGVGVGLWLDRLGSKAAPKGASS